MCLKRVVSISSYVFEAFIDDGENDAFRRTKSDNVKINIATEPAWKIRLVLKENNSDSADEDTPLCQHPTLPESENNLNKNLSNPLYTSEV